MERDPSPQLTRAQKAAQTRAANRTLTMAAQKPTDGMVAQRNLPPRKSKTEASRAWASQIPVSRKRSSSEVVSSDKTKVARKDMPNTRDVSHSNSRQAGVSTISTSKQAQTPKTKPKPRPKPKQRPTSGNLKSEIRASFAPAEDDDKQMEETVVQDYGHRGYGTKAPNALSKVPNCEVPKNTFTFTASQISQQNPYPALEDAAFSSDEDDGDAALSGASEDDGDELVDDELSADGSDLDDLHNDPFALSERMKNEIPQILSSDDEDNAFNPEFGSHSHSRSHSSSSGLQLVSYSGSEPESDLDGDTYTSSAPMVESPRHIKDQTSSQASSMPDWDDIAAELEQEGYGPPKKSVRVSQQFESSDFEFESSVNAVKAPSKSKGKSTRRPLTTGRAPVLPATDNVQVKKSKRQIKAEYEQPTWNDTTSRPGPSGSRSRNATPSMRNSDRPPSHPSASLVRVQRWPDVTAIVLNTRGQIGLKAQSPHIKAMLVRAILKVKGDALFVNAFPDVGESIKYARDALYSCSKVPGLEEIRKRIKNDLEYAEQLAAVPNARLAILRGEFGKAATSGVVGHYSLEIGCPTLIITLKTKSAYIYPTTKKTVVDPKSNKKTKTYDIDKSRPYQNPAIIQVLQTCVFVGSPALATVHRARFEISSTDNTMVSIPMIALAATATYAALDEWNTGSRVPAKFTGAGFADTYQNHVLSILNFRETRKPAYEDMMTAIYEATSYADL